MLKLFQRDITMQSLLVVTALLLLWGRALVAPAPMVAGDHPAVLYGLLCRWIADVPRLAVVLAMLLVLLEGVMLNLLLAQVNLVSQNSLLPTLLFIIAMSASATTLTPAILVTGAAIACLHQLLLRGTLLTIPADKVCGATLLIGVASMCYQPAVLLMASYLLIAANYRLYNWKDWMLMILGFVAPYVLLVLVLYLTNGLAAWWSGTMASLSQFGQWSVTRPTHYTLNIVGVIVLTVLFLWSLIEVMGHISERPVLWQKNASTVLLFTVGGIGMIVVGGQWPVTSATPYTLQTTHLLAIPFAFATYRLFAAATERRTGLGRRKQHLWVYDILLIVTLIAAILC